MAESYIQLPSDAAGKKTRAAQKTVAAQTVYSEYHVEDSRLNFRGSYVICLRIAGSVNAGYQFISLYNPNASGRIFKVKSITIAVDIGSVANQVKVTRTTGLGTGTAQTAVKKDSNFSASISNIVSALIANAALDKTVLGVAKPTTANYALLNVSYREVELEDDQIILREVQGVVVEQLSAGAATEYLSITIEWDEYTVA